MAVCCRRHWPPLSLVLLQPISTKPLENTFIDVSALMSLIHAARPASTMLVGDVQSHAMLLRSLDVFLRGDTRHEIMGLSLCAWKSRTPRHGGPVPSHPAAGRLLTALSQLHSVHRSSTACTATASNTLALAACTISAVG